MKKVRIICYFVCAVLLICALCAPVMAQSDASVIDGCHTVDAARPLGGSEKMLDTSKAVILYERSSDTMVYAYNPDSRIDPSSMAKLMTALIALEEGILDSLATVTREALDQVGIGVVTIKPRLESGETVSLESLIYCMVAASDNDAAVVIAEHIAGSHEAFVNRMNERAKQLGCTDTNFTNAHGLYDENAYTTVRDVCRILDAALDNALFYSIFTAPKYTVPATNKNDAREILTTNYMMSKDYTSKYFDARVTGGKTGTDGSGGRCLAVTAQDNGMEMLAIVMGAEAVYNADNPNILETFGSFEEMKALLDYAADTFEYRQVFYEGQTFSQYPVTGGSNHVVTTPVASAFAVLPADLTVDQLRWVYGNAAQTITAPVEAGQKISHIEVWYGDLCIAQTDLMAMHAVDVYTAPTEPQVSARQDEDNGGAAIAVVIGVILGIVLLTVLILFVVRSVRIATMRARRRRRRMNRRRNR